MKPIHKFNNGNGATLCHKCRTIINTGRIEDLYCDDCKPQERHLIKYMNEDSTIDLVEINIQINQEVFDKGFDISHHLLWGINYTKDRKLLSETQYKLCKDLETSHIEKILEEVNDNMYKIPDIYIKTFNKILNEDRSI